MCCMFCLSVLLSWNGLLLFEVYGAMELMCTVIVAFSVYLEITILPKKKQKQKTKQQFSATYDSVLSGYMQSADT